MIIGLTGKNASGKGVVAEFLQNAGFKFYSLSDALREEIAIKKIAPTRENMIEQGTLLRKMHGAGVLAQKILQKCDIDKNYVIDSFRNPVEVEVFRGQENFFLIHVAALAKIRFERMQERKRPGDPETYEDFEKMEKKEEQVQELAGQQLSATAALADAEIENNSSLEVLHNQIKQVFELFLKKQSRPSWDAYFFNIARMVALRSNCLKRKVAAIIVKDKRIISTGYNGTPRGVTNCNEGGCPRCSQMSQSGTNLEECFCSHAEENAITQAAYHGVSIQNASLYTTFSPCLMCTKMIINSGIIEVIYSEDYPLAKSSIQLLNEAKVKIRKMD